MTTLASPTAADPAGPAAHRGPVPVPLLAEELSTDPRCVHVERLDARDPVQGHLATALPTEVAGRLPHPGLWSHQARAVDLVRSGTSVVVATGTASGKSLCYQVPIAEASLRDRTALAIYPTKALAQDQLQSFTAWGLPSMVAAAFDGDCTPEERTWVRANANVVLTNPEMLHHALLGNHGRWATFLHRLDHVVVDELHTLRGVFGTHVAQVLRRLRRLVRHYGGTDPTFVFTSATVGEPDRLAADLCGRDVVAVQDDGAPRAARTVALWDPTASGPGVGSGSTPTDAAELAAGLIAAGRRTLVFCRSRRATETVASAVRDRLDPAAAARVRSYRSGYLVDERRRIESELAGGELLGVVATSALELGVDIGGLDAVVMCGFPGTIASFRQQLGRCGRRGDESLAVLVAGEDQLDRWMVRHPAELFGRPAERAVVNLDNPHVYVPHLGCAAHELALRHDDQPLWPDQLDEGVRQLVLSERATVRRRRGRPAVSWTGRGSPAHTIGLRSSSRGEVRIVDADGELIGTVDEARAPTTVHPGAVYLHQGCAYRVSEFEPDALRAVVEVCDDDVTTVARTETSIRLHGTERLGRVGRAEVRLGPVEVTTRVTGYEVRRASTRELVSREPLELPEAHMATRAVWYVLDDDLVGDAGVAAADLPGSLHALEHAAIGILPRFAICDRWDVGGVSTTWLPETAAATVVIHDAHPGGAGVAELAFDAAERHLRATLEVVTACACDDGCPSCVQSPKCGNGNEPLDRDGAAALLRVALTEAPPPSP